MVLTTLSTALARPTRLLSVISVVQPSLTWAGHSCKVTIALARYVDLDTKPARLMETCYWSNQSSISRRLVKRLIERFTPFRNMVASIIITSTLTN